MIVGTLSTQDEEKALGVTLSYVYRRYVPTYTFSLAHQTNTQAKAAYCGLLTTIPLSKHCGVSSDFPPTQHSRFLEPIDDSICSLRLGTDRQY